MFPHTAICWNRLQPTKPGDAIPFLALIPNWKSPVPTDFLKAGNFTIHTDNPSSVLRQILCEYKSPHFDYLPPFTGGLVGYFSYDYFGYSEPSVRCNNRADDTFKDLDLMLFDKVIAFDHVRQKIILIVNISLADPEISYNKAVLELKHLAELLKNGEKEQNLTGKLLGNVTSMFDKDTFCNMVKEAKLRIREGDIFQIVLSNCFCAPFEGSLFQTYRILRTLNPSPYMFYFSGTDLEVAGASPETLVKLENGVLRTFPLAGTRPRGTSETETKNWKNSFWLMKKNWPNTICWWIWEEMTLEKSAGSERFRWNSFTPSSGFPM